jgi:hypothetical protein
MERLAGLGRLGSRTIGLDIDRSALKAVQVATSVGAYTLRHSTPADGSRDGAGRGGGGGTGGGNILDSSDSDGDGMSDRREFDLDPANPDSDGDGTLDGQDDEARGGAGRGGAGGGDPDAGGGGFGGGGHAGQNGSLPEGGGELPLPSLVNCSPRAEPTGEPSLLY